MKTISYQKITRNFLSRLTRGGLSSWEDPWKRLAGLRGRRPRKRPRLEKFIAAAGATVRFRSSWACPTYAPDEDVIYMPTLERFGASGPYYVNLFHELIHWTGASRRLDRRAVADFSRLGFFIGTTGKAREELTAELGAYFLRKILDVRDPAQHAEYLYYWWCLIPEPKRRKIFLQASRDAQEATAFLLKFYQG